MYKPKHKNEKYLKKRPVGSLPYKKDIGDNKAFDRLYEKLEVEESYPAYVTVEPAVTTMSVNRAVYKLAKSDSIKVVPYIDQGLLVVGFDTQTGPPTELGLSIEDAHFLHVALGHALQSYFRNAEEMAPEADIVIADDFLE
jgi:hypothetical protein